MKKQKPVIEIVLGAIYTVAFIEGLLLWKLKRWLFRLAIIIFVVSVSLAALQIPIANAPKALAQMPYTPLAHTTQAEQIKAYIKQVFGDQADNAYKVLACENGRLNPNAKGMNTNGTSDVGIFQINSVHGVPESYLKDWRVNVDIAYQIYKSSGWSAWSCVTMYNSLGREDTVK
jgi:hypothetical protein